MSICVPFDYGTQRLCGGLFRPLNGATGQSHFGGKDGKVEIGYRPVHEYTLTDNVEYIKPKKRVY